MSLSETAEIESNSNPQFVIAAFELFKEKTLSRTTAFAKHTSLGISLVEKLNSSFFSPQTLFRSKTQTKAQQNNPTSNLKFIRHSSAQAARQKIAINLIYHNNLVIIF